MVARPRVLIAQADYDGSLASVVEEIFDAFAVDVARKKVLVKPNLLAARPPEEGVTTHPALVAAVIESLEKRGPSEIIVGDNGGMSRYGENEKTAAATGIMDVAGKYYRNLGASPARASLSQPYPHEAAISREILDCEYLVSLPKFKTHALTTLTCAVKNSYGFLLGGEKARLHRESPTREAFARAVVDVFSLRVPDLVICDGILAMQGNGPSSKDVFHLGRVIASNDAVALDAVAARMMGLDPLEVATTREAARRGLGVADLKAMDVDGVLEPIEGFRLPSSFTRRRATDWLARLLTWLVVSQPRADTRACIRCGLCRDHCPTEAITMAPLPVIDRRKCIQCYCCLEFCPEEAMRLSPRVRLIHRLAR